MTLSYSARRQTISAKLHYTDTGYGHVVQHHQRTSSQQFYNLLYNKFATSHCQSPTSRHCQDVRIGKFLSVRGEFVVQEVVDYCCELVRIQHVRIRIRINAINAINVVQVCTTSTTCCELVRWSCPLVVLYNMSVAGVRVVEFGTNKTKKCITFYGR